MRFFNTAGPVNSADHYCLPPLSRFDLADIELLIAQKKYFVLHAPRQVGKTSYLLALMAHLNQQGRYKCLYINVEAAQAMREDIETASRTILSELASRAEWMLRDLYPKQIWLDVLAQGGGGGAIAELLTQWCQASDKPIVLLIDEIDSLIYCCRPFCSGSSMAAVTSTASTVWGGSAPICWWSGPIPAGCSGWFWS